MMWMRQVLRKAHLLALVIALVAVACTQNDETSSLLVTLVVDGRERAMPQTTAVTVDDVLRQAEIELGPLDDVVPPLYSQITDGMRITVARVSEETECDEVEVPYEEQRIPYEALPAGETRLVQPGQNGTQQVCYRVTIRDGVRSNPVQTSTVSLVEAQDAVIYYGPSGELDPATIEGALAYISHNNVWLVRGSSTDGKRQLTNTNDVDVRGFSVTPDGRQIIFTRRIQNEPSIFNRLWLIPDATTNPELTALVPENVLSAQWIPGTTNTISYSTGEAVAESPGFRAYNDLFAMEINPQTGEAIDVRSLVQPSSSGFYPWWPTTFAWSPDGSELACVRADSVGLVDLQTGDCRPLITFPLFETRGPWSWRSSVSFSPDGNLLLTTVHGQPIGSEPPGTSPAFHVAVADKEGTFRANVVENAGIWSMPRYSPAVTNPVTGEQRGYIAYLRARDLSNSINDSAQYDLVIADRDGSNATTIFPPPGQAGLNANATVMWSPDGTQIAFIYQGNVWVIDVASQIAHQLTLDSGATALIWTQ
jgi:Tol biopolymer transport system component